MLDEPNANLDEAGETALITVLRDLKKRGTTVFMIVHQPSVLVAADRVLVSDRGRIGKLAKVVLTPPANPLETPKTTSP